jgi:hypothetical protein
MSAGENAALHDWAREHHVTWETSPRREAPRSAPVGVELTLLGRHPGGHFPSGCEGCVLVWERLRSIVLHALAEARLAFEIDPFEPSVHLRPEGAWAPEVQLTAVIHGPVPPRGLPEKAQIAKLESALEAIGVQRKSWRER